MADITVTFDNGAVERVPVGMTAGEALRAHAARNGASRKAVERAVAARVDGREPSVVDLTRPLVADCGLAPVAPESPEGLDVMRHSCAHLMAQAVKRLFPATEITIGPVIENGFYYDFARAEPFTPEDLPKIEAKMREIIARDAPFTCEVIDRKAAKKLFRDKGETFKLELIDEIGRAHV